MTLEERTKSWEHATVAPAGLGSVAGLKQEDEDGEEQGEYEEKEADDENEEADDEEEISTNRNGRCKDPSLFVLYPSSLNLSANIIKKGLSYLQGRLN